MFFLKKINLWIFLILALMVIGGLIRFPLLNDYPVDRDESARIESDFSFNLFIPPGIMMLTKISAHLFNYSDFGFRFPIFLFGIFGIGAIYILGKSIWGNLEGSLAAFILTFLFSHIVYSNENKEYVPLIFFTTLSWVVFFKIISLFSDHKKVNMKLWIFYVSLIIFGTLFSSYFYILNITYQLIIVFLAYLWVKKLSILKFNSPACNNLKIILIPVALLILFIIKVLFDKANAYFGITFIYPQLSFLLQYWQDLGYFVTQELVLTEAMNGLFILGLILMALSSKFRRIFLIIILFFALDFLLASTLRFQHSAFPFNYIRYHAFLLPAYVIMVAGTVGRLFNLTKNKKRVSILILTIFILFVLQHNFPMIKWYYTVPDSGMVISFKDVGAYLNTHLQKGDTLVRLKNFGMDHKFNHVNHYLNRGLFQNINYSIFPERSSPNNWYVSMLSGEEDELGYSDFLYIERIRPTLRYTHPVISKLRYFGPFIKTRKLDSKDWLIKTSGDQALISYLTDGKTDKLWDIPEDPKTITVDLKDTYTLNSVRLAFNQYPEKFTLSLSKDGINKQEMFKYDGQGASPPNSQIFFLPTPVRYLYIEIKGSGVKEIEAWETYEVKPNIDKEKIYNGESIIRYNFTKDTEGWKINGNIYNLHVENGFLKGVMTNNKALSSSINIDLKPNTDFSLIKVINFTLQVNPPAGGQKAILSLKTNDQKIWTKDIELIPNNFMNYYSINLSDFNIPQDLLNNIRTVSLMPSDLENSEFALDFMAFDKNNLPGIQMQDENSPNGFSQFIPYNQFDDYTFFQIGNKMKLAKGKYRLNFKIKVDQIVLDWRSKLAARPQYRLYEYLEPKDASDSDILTVSIESTRGTFYNSPAYLNIRGEDFKEIDKYYDYSMDFSTNGNESLLIQAFNPRNRRYPANLFITYPEIERIK